MKPARARQIEWDGVLVGGQPHSHICPICAALVPIANDHAGVAFRERHIRWHEASP